MPDVVITSDDGTRHIFPDGFDRKRAEAIVRQKTAQPPASDPAFMHMGERPSGGYTTEEGQEPSPAMEGLSHLAHPQTAGDFATLLLPTGGAAAVSEAAQPVGRALAKGGTVLEKAATSPAARRLSTVGAVTEAVKGNLTGAAIAVGIPKAAEYLGAGLRSLGDVLSGAEALTLREIGALRLKLVDPKLASNPSALAAIRTAIKTRGGKI